MAQSGPLRGSPGLLEEGPQEEQPSSPAVTGSGGDPEGDSAWEGSFKMGRLTPNTVNSFYRMRSNLKFSLCGQT